MVKNNARNVQGIHKEIKGLKHDGTPGPGVPAVFGMNFQAVSVGQKLSKDNSTGSCIADTTFTGQAGGSTDGAAPTTPVPAQALPTTPRHPAPTVTPPQ